MDLPGVSNWMNAQSASLFLSVVTIAEVEDGIAKPRREKATRLPLHASTR